MNLVDVAEEIAVRLRSAPTLAGRTYAEVQPKIVPPCAIVAYPTGGTYDRTYRRGKDSMTVPVVVAVGLPEQRGTLARLAGYINGSGPESVHVLLEGEEGSPSAYASCDTVSVTGWETDTYSFAGTEYLVAVFQVDITGPGEG